ncbi:MAG: exopolysaccharide biosynthesis polyprenyl glycosylphosphotransferase [Firmicutes bacterium]|nr:exopolysaccharide biosynthesis polyprenyl glycosylphosphotransferase [Bacillota bacterium]
MTENKRLIHKLFTEFCSIINVLLETAVFGACWYLYYRSRLSDPFFRKGDWVVIFIFLVLYVGFCHIYSGLKINVPQKSEIVYSQFLSILFSNVIIYLIILLLMKRLPPAWPLLLSVVAEIIVSLLWTITVHKLYFAITPPYRSVVVWDTREGLDTLVESYGLNIRFNIVRRLGVEDCLADLDRSLEDIEVVFLWGIHSHERNQIIKYCIANGIRAYVIPRVGDVIMSGAKSMHMFHLPVLFLERCSPSPMYLFFKRLVDIVVSGLALIILSPTLLVVALLIRRDGGPAFYRQTRLTKDGKTFEVLKFRSMRTDAEKDGVARLSTGENDDRITPIGRFIRSCRIDELPQLINIFKGEMTIVGPRPERPEIAKQYEEEMPEFSLRLQVKAGLTGLAQVYGKYNTTPYDKLLMDLEYISRIGIVEDIRIMFATVKILFMPESTEGISAGQVTAMDHGDSAD